jgi:hypothetical protein
VRQRAGWAAAAAVAVAGTAFPAAAQAHGLVGRQDLPIPRLLFVWAASAVLIASFVGLATLWPTPRLEGAVRERRLLRLPRALVPVCGAIGVAVFALVVYAGLAGTQTPTANLAPTAIYVLFWVGLAVASLLFGDVFRPFNPWRAIGRGVGWAGHRLAGGRLPEPLAYPERLGRWPAALGLLAFAWLELVYGGAEDPSVVAVAALLYAGVQLLGMSLYGVEAWSRNGDAFGVYFGLLARLGPLDWRGRELWARPLLAGATGIRAVPGTVAVLVVLIGTTSFDGFSQGPTWNDVAPDLQTAFIDLGLGQQAALELAFTLGLLVVVGLVGLLYRLGTIGMRSIDTRFSAAELGRRFAHSLLPIALAYVIAHYFSYLAIQGQAIGYLASDPLGDGSNLFGTATASIDYGVISSNGIWYVQVAALVLGHVAGLVLAHDRALATYEDARAATRSQYWMLTVMVAFTCLGLWLLSAQAA